MSQRAQRAIYRSLALGATPYRLPESQQCKAEIVDERERYGRNVVAQVRCRKMTRDESGYCHIHRQNTDDMTADTDTALAERMEADGRLWRIAFAEGVIQGRAEQRLLAAIEDIPASTTANRS